MHPDASSKERKRGCTGVHPYKQNKQNPTNSAPMDDPSNYVRHDDNFVGMHHGASSHDKTPTQYGTEDASRCIHTGMDTVSTSRSLIEQNGFALSKTSGRSMRPLIWGGQHCVAVVPLEGEPALGDLLMFKQTLPDGKERSIVHRLVEIRNDSGGPLYITRGDNCLGCETVRREEIIGRVAEVHRISGFRPWHIIPKRKFTVNDTSYRIYSRIWAAIWPARRLYYRIRARLRIANYK